MLDFCVLISAFPAQQDTIHCLGILLAACIIHMTPNRAVSAVSEDEALKDAVLVELSAGIVRDGLQSHTILRVR